MEYLDAFFNCLSKLIEMANASYIGRTNLFNFIVFMIIWVAIFRVAHIGEKLENAKNNIIDHINEAKDEKDNSVNHLDSIKETVSHIEEEIDNIIKKSEENAQLVGQKIVEDAHKQVEGVQQNLEKSIENRTVLLKNDILKRVSLASIEIAKKHIENELNVNSNLHNQLIDESINAIDGVKF